ncbi:ABC transporter permease [Streptomyces rhizosphaerihabitans]|uniref:ABC transporter permease n=1 Tax=Streptomyces rhizosphaerihabitans TaxID=1266770 RepID=UPI0021BE0366|nr:ABC transporter permease [Streptomyces rhizosphaerihabitans]MCT9007532.1 ABC transporter permease [Streptomyces rhizosphaerihabitans]
MNFIKRAGLSLWSRKARTLITLGTFLVICTMVLAGFLIGTATGRAADSAERRLGAAVTLEMDLTGAGGGMPGQAPQIGSDVVDRIGGSPLVAKYNYTYNDGTTLLGGLELTSSKRFASDAPATYTLAAGVRDSSLLPDFASGNWKLLSGEHVTAADQNHNEVLIEERLASKNHLKVGDKMTLSENDPTGKGKAVFTVKGIYHNPSDQPDPDYQQAPGDKLIVPAGALGKLNSGGKQGPTPLQGATFQLKDAAAFDAFHAQADRTAGNALKGFKLSINDKALKQMTGPLDSVTTSATAAMWLIGIAGGLVLGLLATLAVKQRRTEFGILLSLGETKWKLVAQQCVEIVVVAVLAIGLSSVFAQNLTQKAGDTLLHDQAASAQRKINAWQPPPPGSTGLEQGIDPNSAPVKGADPIDKITVRLQPSDVATVAGIGLGIGLLATAIPAASALRLNPRRILTKGK